MSNSKSPDRQRLLVGYRDDDPRRYQLRDCPDPGGLEIAKCADCHHPVYVDRSGRDCYMSRDPTVVCMFCQEHYRYVERGHQSGLVVQV